MGSAAIALTVLLSSAIAPAAAAAPSFDCAGKITPTERVICADDSLAALDRVLTAAYKNKFDGLPVESANALDEVVQSLVITQRAWVAHRNSCGTDAACIRKAYQLRTGDLTAGPNTPDVPCRDIVGAQQAAIFVRQCTEVATATHPPCNAENTCELIVSHNVNRCVFLGDQAPKFCATYGRR
jgi:uncharacterized protein